MPAFRSILLAFTQLARPDTWQDTAMLDKIFAVDAVELAGLLL